MRTEERRSANIDPGQSQDWMDPNRITLRFWKGRLCTWRGNVQKWIEQDRSGEISVLNAPVVGHVPCVRLVNGTSAKVMSELPRNVVGVLQSGMAVVMRRADLPERAQTLL